MSRKPKRRGAAATGAAPDGPARLPGDPAPAETVARMLRVDHAGEYGARRIYEGQLAVLGGTPSEAPVRRMAEQEAEHLAAFERLLGERRVRPTALQPLWHAAGFLLGAGTALLGERAAMACTVAVEEEIVRHYRRQAARLGADEAELRGLLERYADEEDGHRAEALRHGAEAAPGYRPLSRAIRLGTRLAIRLSERI